MMPDGGRHALAAEAVERPYEPQVELGSNVYAHAFNKTDDAAAQAIERAIRGC
jgi:hypothetical protein